MAQELIKVPDLGNEDAKGTVTEININPGDVVSVDDHLLTLESDKASVEVPAPKAGKAMELLVKVGDVVSEGMDILRLEVDDGVSASETAPEPTQITAAAPEPPPTTAAAASPLGGSQTVEIRVPDISGAKAPVVEVCVAVGDQVQVDDPLITLESDKASMDVPATLAGRVVAVHVAMNEELVEGDLVVTLEGEMDTLSSDGNNKASEPTAPQPTPVPVAASAAGGQQSIEIRVPDIGGAKAPVVEIAVTVGDKVQIDDPLITLESDKASMDVPATHAGKVVTVHVNKDDELVEGDLVVTLQGEVTGPGAAPDITKQTASVAVPGRQTPAATVAPPTQTTSGPVYAGPAVRRLAREFGVDLTQVTGSGPKGRLLKEDVQNFVKRQLSGPAVPATASAPVASTGAGIPAIPEVDFSQWGEIECQPLNRLRTVAAQNFQRSWLNIPHVTQFDEADITELEAFRKAQKAFAEIKGVRLTPLPFMLKAAAYALKEMPQFGASLSADGQTRILKKYINIGIAVDTPDGLLVPVIKDVDKKGLWELAAECAEMADKARKKKLKPAEMKGGCFTLSSLGSIGGTAFTPIVNSPEVAILGISKASLKPQWNGKEFTPRLMLPLSLSYDHRAINGAEAAQFAVLLSTLLADIRKLLL